MRMFDNAQISEVKAGDDESERPETAKTATSHVTACGPCSEIRNLLLVPDYPDDWTSLQARMLK